MSILSIYNTELMNVNKPTVSNDTRWFPEPNDAKRLPEKGKSSKMSKNYNRKKKKKTKDKQSNALAAAKAFLSMHGT